MSASRILDFCRERNSAVAQIVTSLLQIQLEDCHYKESYSPAFHWLVLVSPSAWPLYSLCVVLHKRITLTIDSLL